MVMDVILNVQSTVKIAFVTYKPELVLHADQDGKGTLVKKVQLCNHVTKLIQLTVVHFLSVHYALICSLANHF